MALIMRVALIFLLFFAATLGAHFRGILIPQVRLITFFVLLVVVVTWLLARRLANWKWHNTPLDLVLPIWLLAFGLSLFMNLDAQHRILLGLWYMGIYIGLWYILHDVLSNWRPARKMLVDGLLFLGILVLAFSVIEWKIAVLDREVDLFDYRFHGLLGNPNFLGTFLTIFILIALGRLSAIRKKIAQISLGVCLLFGMFLLFLTGTRGAWIGTSAAIFVWLLLIVQGRAHIPLKLMALWYSGSLIRRIYFISGIILFITIAGMAAIWIGGSFINNERGLSLRPELFNVALHMFMEKPLTGQGIFTYGRHLGRFFSLPPMSVHSHAHNIFIQIAGELGLVGLIAFSITIVAMVRSAWITQRQLTSPERSEWYTATAATVGFGVVHMTDVTAMLPFLAILGMITLLLATTPPYPQSINSHRRIPLHYLALAALWIGLFISAGWDLYKYIRYSEILEDVFVSNQYAKAASHLQPLVEADPEMVVYPAQQAFLWGLAAINNDSAAQQKAITTYEWVVSLEPYYAPYFTNLGALYWSAGDRQKAVQALQRAGQLAPDSWQIHYMLGLYAEMLGIEEVAQSAYSQALSADPDVDLYPDWGQTELQQKFKRNFQDRSIQAQTVLLMEADQINQAVELWEAELTSTNQTNDLVLQVLLSLEQGNRVEAQKWYERAAQAPNTWESERWLLLAKARLAQYDGSKELYADALDQARAIRAYDPFKGDYIAGADAIYYQFFHNIIPRQFLPQVFYPVDRVILLYLLDKSL